MAHPSYPTTLGAAGDGATLGLLQLGGGCLDLPYCWERTAAKSTMGRAEFIRTGLCRLSPGFSPRHTPRNDSDPAHIERVSDRSRSVISNGIVMTVAVSNSKDPSLYVQACDALATIERNLAEGGFTT